MGVWSWIKEAVASRVKNSRIYKKVTESETYKTVAKGAAIVANGASITLEFLRANRDGLNKSMTQFIAGLLRVAHVGKLLLLPIFYPDTYRALSASQKQPLLRFLAIFGYHQAVRPVLTVLSDLSHSSENYLINGVGYTLDGLTYTADGAMIIWTVREATTAMFLDNMIYNAAVAVASARDGKDKPPKEKSTNPLMIECGDGGYTFTKLMNGTTYIVNKVVYVAACLLTSYAPWYLKSVTIVAGVTIEGFGYMQYLTDGMCIDHQNEYSKYRFFDALARGVTAQGFYHAGMWMLTSKTPYQFAANYLIPSAVITYSPLRFLAYLEPFEPGFILSFTLGEVVMTSTALTLIALTNMTRDMEIMKGTQLFNFLYPSQLLTEKIGGYIGAQGKAEYKAAKQVNPKDWVTVANDKLVAWWDGYAFWGFRKVFIRNCPESWDDLMKRPSMQVYWAADKGQLKKSVADTLVQLTSPGAKIGRKLGVSKIADSLFFLNDETRMALKYFMKRGVVRILRATDNVLQRVVILDDEVPSNQPRQVEASRPIDDLTKMRAIEPSRVNLRQRTSSGIKKSPSNSRATSATSAGSVNEIHQQLMLAGGSRVKGLPAPSSVRIPRKPVAAVSSPRQPDMVTEAQPVHSNEIAQQEENMTFLMEDAFVLPVQEKQEPTVVEIVDETEMQEDVANDNAGGASVVAESVDERDDSLPPQLEKIIDGIKAQEAEDTQAPSQVPASVEPSKTSPQMLVLKREWDQREHASQVAVSAPVAIPQPVAPAKPNAKVMSVEEAEKRGISRIALGLRGKK